METGPIWLNKSELIKEVAKKMGIKLVEIKVPTNYQELHPEDFIGIPVVVSKSPTRRGR